MIKILDNQLYNSSGRLIKTLNCPKNITKNDLIAYRQADSQFRCLECEKIIHDTDRMTEVEIVELFERDPDACVSIHPLNPIFDIQKA